MSKSLLNREFEPRSKYSQNQNETQRWTGCGLIREYSFSTFFLSSLARPWEPALILICTFVLLKNHLSLPRLGLRLEFTCRSSPPSSNIFIIISGR